MKKEKLYEILDIDHPKDFQYFENLANFFESEDEIEFEELAQLMKEIDKEVLSELIAEYFDEILDSIPSEELNMYTLLTNIKRSLLGMLKDISEDNLEVKIAEELERFRTWYSIDSEVSCKSLDDFEEKNCVVRDAFVLSRLEHLDGVKYQYDFSEAEDYELDEYIMSFGDMIALGEGNE